MKARILAVFAGTVIGVTGLAVPSAAHDDGGLFQPHIADFVVEAEGPAGGRAVWVRVVDADSAQSAEGMSVTVGTATGSSVLDEVALGYYAGEAPVTPGAQVLTVSVRSRAGGPLTRDFDRSWRVTVPPAPGRAVVAGKGNTAALRAAEQHPLHQARLAAAEQGRGLRVEIEAVEDETLASPLYVRLHVHLRRDATGELDPTNYEVWGWAAGPSGDRTEFIRFTPLDAINPEFDAGVYGGVIILPEGGSWTVKAAVLEVRAGEHQTDPPVHLVEGELPITREGKALLGAQEALDRAAEPRANIFNTMVLGLHSLSGAAWGALLLVLLAFSYGGAKWLSASARNLVERHLDPVVSATWAMTGLVTVTGVYNLYKESPYRTVPNSWTALQETLALPFARPYYAALAVKLLAYGALLWSGVRVIRSAKAFRAGTVEPAPPAERTPWRPPAHIRPHPSRPGAGEAGGRSVGVLVADPGADPAGEAPRTAPRRSLPSMLIPTMALSTIVIIICVTILKSAHLLAEVTRAAS